MKLHQVLTVGGISRDLVKADVRLELRNPGRATFTVQAEVPLSGLVTFDLGYNDKPLQRHFIGYVERSTAANAKQQVLFCRELAAILAKPLPMNLRHVDLRGVLEEISNQTGLRFRVPDRPYAATRAPFFYSLATGFQAMESLAQVFNIPDFIWQQQGDGEVFVGSWSDSYFGVRPALQLPIELFDDYQGNQSAMIAALPGLRPGASINQGERVTQVALAGNQMAIRWKTQSAAQ
ncbi:hypothetical protein [Pseudomonas guariconensis]|uniref:Prophage PssSM-01 n=1 Tax=Pseudomonas guariconensis TaxID=1288410 RepID=A0AAX0W1Y4_9PSED|nr:hypothetical protein [Pseudomonas guariconensis]MCO7620783.1 hypothetical protein [Pseudomonas guariconensis]PLV21137.1 hypothetical protein CXG49_00895 [Pseudomonas guariconensis]PLV26015.1 hypothetical protein CXG53_00895 [Pseudomonas guariconensis]PLV31091.1 hypothetical protein CXG51_00895 [Pseudomonas guariconensis]